MQAKEGQPISEKFNGHNQIPWYGSNGKIAWLFSKFPDLEKILFSLTFP